MPLSLVRDSVVDVGHGQPELFQELRAQRVVEENGPDASLGCPERSFHYGIRCWRMRSGEGVFDVMRLRPLPD